MEMEPVPSQNLLLLAKLVETTPVSPHPSLRTGSFDAFTRG